MIRSMKGFTFASALDLNMGYYHIKLDADYSFSKAMYHCIPMVDGKIQIQTLTHGYQDCLDPDVFQNYMSKLVQDTEYVKRIIYVDGLLILTYSDFKDHLLKLEMVLARLSTAGMRVNISKSKLFEEQVEYLGYWITRQVIQSIRNKIKISAILNIKAPKTRKSEASTPVYWYSQLLSQYVVS
jgi:hypothetical protein